MRHTTIAISKFVGSISLGLLTGVSYTLSTLTLPSLLSLPTLPPARSAFLTLRKQARKHQLSLSILSSTSLVLAYLLSPRRGRHPYLLWTAATVVLSANTDWILLNENAALQEERLREEDINGEMVREGMEGWRRGQIAKAGITAAGFAMSLVGIWGDGF